MEHGLRVRLDMKLAHVPRKRHVDSFDQSVKFGHVYVPAILSTQPARVLDSTAVHGDHHACGQRAGVNPNCRLAPANVPRALGRITLPNPPVNVSNHAAQLVVTDLFVPRVRDRVRLALDEGHGWPKPTTNGQMAQKLAAPRKHGAASERFRHLKEFVTTSPNEPSSLTLYPKPKNTGSIAHSFGRLTEQPMQSGTGDPLHNPRRPRRYLHRCRLHRETRLC